MKTQTLSLRTHNGDSYRPRTVTVSGETVPIRWDFETAFRFIKYVDKSNDDDETFLNTVLSIWYPKIPNDRNGALDEAIRFYCGGTFPKHGYYTPILSPDTRREAVYSDFRIRYGIDLNREKLHWWTFRRLALQPKYERKRSWTKKNL